MTISRLPCIPGLDAFRAATLEDILDGLRRYTSPDASLFVADLTLGAWRSEQVAREFLGQLGVSLPAEGSEDSRGSGIGFWIDVENRGGATLINALCRAETTLNEAVAAAPATFLILAPRYDGGWGEDNERFIAALAQGVRDSKHRLLIAFAPGDAVSLTGVEIRFLDDGHPTIAASTAQAAPADYYSFIPGAIDPAVAQQLVAEGAPDDLYGLRLSHGWVLVPPERRKPPRQWPASILQSCLPMARRIGWLYAFWNYALPEGHPDYGALVAEAWRRLQEGGGDIARRLIQRALQTAPNGASRAAFIEQYQWMRIATHRFHEAGEEADPPEGLAPERAGTLFWQKAWGLVMSHRPGEAQPHFEKALELLDYADNDINKVYLLNIYALNRMRLGAMEDAVAIEKKIEGLFSSGAVKDWHMEYINYLNLARLMRKTGDGKAARKYYSRAFDTARGSWNEVDAVYLNLSEGLLAHGEGDLVTAAAAWFRAAVFYAALAYPEAVGWRITETLRAAARAAGVADPGANADVETCAALLLNITRASAMEAGMGELARNLDGSMKAEQAPVFVTWDMCPAGASLDAVGSDGWGVLAGTVSRMVPAWDGPAHRQLRRGLFGAMRFAVPAAPWREPALVVTDDRRGFNMPCGRERILQLAVTRKVATAYIGDEKITLTDNIAGHLMEMARFSLSPAVGMTMALDGGVLVRFNRYFTPCRIDGDEAALVNAVTCRPAGVGLEDGCATTGLSRKRFWEAAVKLSDQRILAAQGNGASGYCGA
ncbi:MAG: tetratricopeptide repeat protein [Nitrospinae bacterium]|nr:tetratricopeptide repeat protein [Nitrospinota bacterium]